MLFMSAVIGHFGFTTISRKPLYFKYYKARDWLRDQSSMHLAQANGSKNLVRTGLNQLATTMPNLITACEQSLIILIRSSGDV